LLALCIISLVLSFLSIIGNIIFGIILYKALTKVIGPAIDKAEDDIKKIASRV